MIRQWTIFILKDDMFYGPTVRLDADGLDAALSVAASLSPLFMPFLGVPFKHAGSNLPIYVQRLTSSMKVSATRGNYTAVAVMW